VVINYFHIFRACIRPTEADTPLIVNTNTVLTGTITFECFKMISRGNSQIPNLISDLKLSEFTPCNISNIYELLDMLTFRECFCVFAFKRSYHMNIMTHNVTNVKRDYKMLIIVISGGGNEDAATLLAILCITLCTPGMTNQQMAI